MTVRWIRQLGAPPVVFLPADLDMSNCVDVTCVGDYYAKYMNTMTGRVHDCKKYYEQAEKEILA